MALDLRNFDSFSTGNSSDMFVPTQLHGALVTDLTTLVGRWPNAVVECSGYRAQGDGGGGQFRWDQGSSTTADGGLVVGSTSYGRWKRLFQGDIDVRWFGADSSGVADSTTAIQAAIDSSSGGVYFPAGTYKVTSTLTVSLTKHLHGDGMRTSTISFSPSANDTCLLFSAGASVLYQSSICDITIYAPSSSHTKIAVEVIDNSGFLAENVSISGNTLSGSSYFWGGNGSTGFLIKGREFGLYKNIEVYADRPIRLSDNPNSVLDCDHHRFEDCYLGANGYPIITVDDGMFLSNVGFYGDQAWVLGTHGFYWNDTTSTATSNNISFENVRTEQGEGSAGAYYSIYIASNSSYRQAVRISECYLDSFRNGVYMRNVRQMTIEDSVYGGTLSPQKAIDATGFIGATLSFKNFLAVSNSIKVLTAYRAISLGPLQDSLAPFPPNAEYAYQGNLVTDYPEINGSKVLYFAGTVANNGTVDLLCGSANGATVAYVSVAVHGPTKDAAGSAMAANGVGTLIAGTALFAVGSVANKFNVLVDSLCRLYNTLGETVTYTASVMWK